MDKKTQERQTSLEQADLDICQIGRGVFAEAPLLAAVLFPIAKLLA